MNEVLTLCKRKRPHGWARWQAYAVGGDEHGTWLFTPAGSTYLGDDERGTRTVVPSARDRHGVGRDLLVLLRPDRWWAAQFVFTEHLTCAVDICTPPVLAAGVWDYVDLELDPVLLPDGTVFVDDEDEFADALAADLITDEERGAAVEAGRWWTACLTADPSELVETARRHFEHAVGRGLDPLPHGAD